jgi:hypothetical protein
MLGVVFVWLVRRVVFDLLALPVYLAVGLPVHLPSRQGPTKPTTLPPPVRAAGWWVVPSGGPLTENTFRAAGLTRRGRS